MMGGLIQYLSFAAMWLGITVLIGIALWITGKFRTKDDKTSVDPREYAENFEKELAESTPEKPIKKQFRNPFYLSTDEIEETKNSIK